MKGKTLLILSVSVILLGGAALFWSGDPTSDSGKTKMGDRLFADLPVNNVAFIEISDGDHQVTLKKGDSIWQVEERHGYPANFDAIRDLVVSFSRMKIGRTFTGTPESLERLSLLAPSSETAKGRGTGIVLKDGTGKILADVVLGETRTPGDNRSGQYIKPRENNSVFLVDGSFRFLKAAPEDWLKDEILNIRAADVEMVTAYGLNAKTPAYTLVRPEKDTPPHMTPVPAGKAVDPEKVEQVLEALGPLILHDVRSAEDDALPVGSPHLTYRLYDGWEITLFLGADEGKNQYTVRIVASAAESIPADGVESKAVPDDPPLQISEEEAGHAYSPEGINAAVGGWVFFLQKWQYDSLITEPELLLVPPSPATTQSSRK